MACRSESMVTSLASDERRCCPSGPLPEEWLTKWQEQSPVPLIPTWEDPDPLYEPIPRKAEITEKNAQMLSRCLTYVYVRT